MAQNYEQLFLLEVLVEELKLLSETLRQHAPASEDEEDTPLRVRVKFSEFPCFEITQDLAPPCKEQNQGGGTSTIYFCSGKSCMFPMDPEQLIDDLSKYPLTVTIFKKTISMPVPDVIGQTKVFLTDDMTKMVEHASKWALDEPTHEVLRDMFPIRNAMEQDVGQAALLIRLSCFGKTIVTKFQIAENNKAFMFKNSRVTDPEFRCKKCMPGQAIVRYHPPQDYEEEYEDVYYQDELPGETTTVGPASTATEQMLEPVENIEAGPLADRMPPEEGAAATGEPARGYGEMKAGSTSGRSKFVDDPNVKRQHMQGPGFTASMEVRYPGWEDPNKPKPCPPPPPPPEPESEPCAKGRKGKKGGKGKSGSGSKEKIEVENPVELGKEKKKRSKYCDVPAAAPYPGVVIGHKWCLGGGDLIPAKHGWAWKTTVPAGMEPDDMRGWYPGCIAKKCLKTIKYMKAHPGKPKRKKRRKMGVDNRKPTVHIHRLKGTYHVTMNPPRKPGDTQDPDPVLYTVDSPDGEDSDISDLELDLTIPDPPYGQRPPVKHQAQQFCEEDLPLIEKKSRAKSAASDKSKKKGKKGKKDKKGKKGKKGKKKKEKKEKVKPKKPPFKGEIHPWDQWIFKLKCGKQGGAKSKKGKGKKGKGKKGKGKGKKK